MSTLLERIGILVGIENVVSDVGETMLELEIDTVEDVEIRDGKEVSNVDEIAYNFVMEAIYKHLPEFRGGMLSEHNNHTVERVGFGLGGEIRGLLVLDEIEGTTCYKRWLKLRSSASNVKPNALVSLGLCEGGDLGSITVGAVYDMRNGDVLSGLLGSNGVYHAYCNGELVTPIDLEEVGCDSAYRITVPGYSNTMQAEIGVLRQAIWDSSPEPNLYRTYGGTRPTGTDIVSIVTSGMSDAYVDPRALWGPESRARLQPHDIAGVLPFAWGSGLETCDIFGEPIEGYPVTDDRPLTLIVAKKGLGRRIVEAIRPVIESLG
jgi:fructose-1,6-bisphosphatase/inositol monophosphatase family enzyme